MYSPRSGMCDKCRQEKMVCSRWINGSVHTYCANCLKEIETNEVINYERYLNEITDPRD